MMGIRVVNGVFHAVLHAFQDQGKQAAHGFIQLCFGQPAVLHRAVRTELLPARFDVAAHGIVERTLSRRINRLPCTCRPQENRHVLVQPEAVRRIDKRRNAAVRQLTH